MLPIANARRGCCLVLRYKGQDAMDHLRNLWSNEEGQDVAEYSVMLAVVLVIIMGTIRLIGTNANQVFSQVGSAIVP